MGDYGGGPKPALSHGVKWIKSVIAVTYLVKVMHYVKSIRLALKVGKMKEILHSDWLPEQARWAYLAPLGLTALFPQK